MIDKTKIKDTIEDLLVKALSERNADTQGLLDFLEESGFYEAPASGGNHLHIPGGLAQHSLNVFDAMNNIYKTMTDNIDFSSVVICSILHDLGKVGDFSEPNYIENYLKSGKVSTSKPYATNPNIPYVDHEIRSVEFIRRYIELSPEEYQAILFHNGLYGTFYRQISGKETPLYLLLHFADMWASRVTEKEC